MLWKLVRKIARLYALLAIGVLGLMMASNSIVSYQLNDSDALLALFFPYGVLAGLIVSLLFMRIGGWLTILSVGGFYLVIFWKSGMWPGNNLPLMIGGAAPLFLLSNFLRSLGQKSGR
jgi:hypothetical protein